MIGFNLLLREGRRHAYRACLLLFCFLSGCASIPNVDYTYYPAKMTAVATATQTVSCSPNGQAYVIVNSANLAPTYSSQPRCSTAESEYQTYRRDIRKLCGQRCEFSIL
jgi:hypothetical protein